MASSDSISAFNGMVAPNSPLEPFKRFFEVLLRQDYKECRSLLGLQPAKIIQRTNVFNRPRDLSDQTQIFFTIDSIIQNLCQQNTIETSPKANKNRSPPLFTKKQSQDMTY